MTDLRRVYYYIVTGACGGLTGWFISTLSLSGLELPRQSRRRLALYGAILGAAIGLAITAYDGLMNRSARRFVKFGIVGLALGALAGAVALPLADWLYVSLLAALNKPSRSVTWESVLVGTFCWAIFGGLIGLAEGVSKGTQVWKGCLGGVSGGLVGGLLYQTAAGGVDTEEVHGQTILALSLLVLGATIGAAVAYVTEVLKGAWLEILDGKFAGRKYDVTKYVDRNIGRHRAGAIGSDQWRAHIYLPGDREVLPLHAEINFANGAPTLTVAPEVEGRAATFINGRQLTTSIPLSDGDRLQFGSTKVVYRHKRRR